ncbi:hypothetical protein [Anaeropeptidivorans aminofermentans]|jgi:hypothetical protein|uniref:hypothetical protein n=1 Tax=Anaeropeptidivorans aminofermentans TaxID=2934315 RepID=UPI0020247DD7|nr:hypothetical protein [Anaeropeptidivorans aminofermentans]MBE6013586.1 hypothetical protein [Lachnospiraceae bacterium]
MRNKGLLFFTFIFVLFLQVYAFANSGSIKEAKAFEITSGFGEKESETTFDTSRTLTGRGLKGTEVKITVSVPNPEFDEKLPESEENAKEIIKETYEINIGALGFFSQDIDLLKGENIIKVNAEKGGVKYQFSYTINRKSLEIKQELEENNIILPGQIQAASGLKSKLEFTKVK